MFDDNFILIMAIELINSRSFARSLKTYGSFEYYPNMLENCVVSARGVTSFNKKAFQNKCNPASINYDSSINLNDVSDELFQVGEIWSSRDMHLYPAMQEHAKLHAHKLIW